MGREKVQANELSLGEAVAEAPCTALRLAGLAQARRDARFTPDRCSITRHWEPGAATYCYHTRIAITGQASHRLDELCAVFFDAATLPRQPWYPQFLGGSCQPVAQTAPADIEQQQLTCARFDLGIGTPRCYRQLLSLARPDSQTAVIVARSVDVGPPLPDRAPLAYTLAPNGEVLYREDDRLHWHHICCTPGPALLPGRLDRWLINSLRRLRLDRAERATYRQEAELLRDWLQGEPGPLLT